MSNYIETENYIVVRRHFILMFFKFAKFIFLLLISFFIYFVLLKYWDIISKDLKSVNYIVFSFCFITLNYAFLNLILYVIEYYNKVIIISSGEIFFIRSSLILRDDLEVLDLYRVMTIDSYCHWLFSNIFNFWEVVIEQQKIDDDNNNKNVRKLYFIPNPYKLVSLIKDKKRKVLEERKQRYFVKNPSENIHEQVKKIIKR